MTKVKTKTYQQLRLQELNQRMKDDIESLALIDANDVDKESTLCFYEIARRALKEEGFKEQY